MVSNRPRKLTLYGHLRRELSDRLPANRCFSTNRHDPNLLRSSVCPPESSTSGHALSACSSAAVSIVNPEPKCGPPPTLYTPAIRCG